MVTQGSERLPAVDVEGIGEPAEAHGARCARGRVFGARDGRRRRGIGVPSLRNAAILPEARVRPRDEREGRGEATAPETTAAAPLTTATAPPAATVGALTFTTTPVAAAATPLTAAAAPLTAAAAPLATAAAPPAAAAAPPAAAAAPLTAAAAPLTAATAPLTATLDGRVLVDPDRRGSCPGLGARHHSAADG